MMRELRVDRRVELVTLVIQRWRLILKPKMRRPKKGRNIGRRGWIRMLRGIRVARKYSLLIPSPCSS